MSKKYLVTGGTGFLGRALVERLVKDGHHVRVFDNDSRGSINTLSRVSKEIEFVKGDIRDPEQTEKACRGIDSICHLAFINGTEYFYQKPELVLEVGVKGMVNILDGAIKNNVKDFMVMSSSEVYQTPPHVPTDESAPLSVPDPLNPRYSYGGGKIISELMAINYGRKYFDRTVIVRPHNAYGPQMGYEHVIPQFCMRMGELTLSKKHNYEFPIQGTGQETRSFVYIDDFTDGVMVALNRGENLGIYHNGTMDERTIADLAHEVAKNFGVKIELKTGALTQGSTSRRCPDIGKLKKLGYSPRISFEEGVRRTVEWYKNNPKKV
jgi:nucleoside-diphosphate-sugar epimerase